MNARIAFFLALLPSVILLLQAPAAAPRTPLQAADGSQDFVFLTQARPLLFRIHVQLSGKAVLQTWADFMAELFAYLDVDGDGILSKTEAERVPSPDVIRSAGLNVGRANTIPTLARLDLDKDGKVSRAELAMYYREGELAPFQFQLDPLRVGANVALFRNRGIDPPLDRVSEALFVQADANRDGNLTPTELAQAPSSWQRLDEDEDEILSLRETVPDFVPNQPASRAMAMMPGKKKDRPEKIRPIIPLEYRGRATPALSRALEQFSPASKEDPAALVGRTPDVEVRAMLGEEPRLEGKSLLEDGVSWSEGQGLIDLGGTRIQIRGAVSTEAGFGNLAGLVRQQVLAVLRGADKDNNGYIDATEAKNNPVFGNLYRSMDRDGDGKLYEKEVLAYLDKFQQFQEKALTSCVTLLFVDQGKGLFSLLDANRDGRLSVREMRGAADLMRRLDRTGKGHLTRADLPNSYELTLRPGPSGTDPLEGAAALYSGADDARDEVQSKAGPLWFRKMDRNRDGDVSRKEWVFSEEQFRLADADGDGLISVAEALRYQKTR